MFVKTKKVITRYTRISSLGIKHAYSRTKTIAILKCDCCNSTFERELGKIDHRRLNNNTQHVCVNCTPKQFAQARGVENRRLWNLPVDSDIKIDKL